MDWENMKIMFKKMMMVLAVLLVCLLAISAVSAETDAAGTDSSADGVDSTDEAVLGSSETDELQNDNDPLSVDAGSGKTYTVNTDVNGYASLAINLKAGKYTITTVYGGTTVTNTITVKAK